jgi:hypothetical protein
MDVSIQFGLGNPPVAVRVVPNPTGKVERNKYANQKTNQINARDQNASTCWLSAFE